MNRVDWGPLCVDLEVPPRWAGSIECFAPLPGAARPPERWTGELSGGAETSVPLGARARAVVDGARLCLHTHWAHVELDFSRRHVVARLATHPVEGVDTPRRVYGAFRAALLGWAQVRGALCLHGATLLQGERAVIFVGPSGAGKTTLVRSHPQLPALGDDLVLLTGPDGKSLAMGTAVRAWGSPFSGREGLASARGQFPLRSAFRLRQGPRTAAWPCTPAQAVGALAPHVFGLIADDTSRRRTLEALAIVAQAVPVSLLDVSLDRSPFSLEELA